MGNSAIHNALSANPGESGDKDEGIHTDKSGQIQPSPQIYIQTNDLAELPLWAPYTSNGHKNHVGDDSNDPTQTAKTSTANTNINEHPKQSSREDDTLVQEAVDRTIRWCSHFVVPLRLCPWTASSLNSQGAVRIYVLKSASFAKKKRQPEELQKTSSRPSPSPATQQIMEYTMEAAIHEASQQLRQDVQNGKVSQKVAIAFCIMVTSANDHDPQWDFDSFYDWFFEFEDRLLEEAEHDTKSIGEYVTPAPFHPHWQFEGDDDALSFEKRSPYPTVSIVCTSEIEKAGDEVTQQIGIQNAHTLTNMGSAALEEFYEKNVYQRSAHSQSYQKPYATIEDMEDDHDDMM